MREVFLLSVVGLLQVYGHLPKAKVNVDRKHEHHQHQVPDGTQRIHVRNSGLENFGKGDDQGRNVLHSEEFVRNVE